MVRYIVILSNHQNFYFWKYEQEINNIDTNYSYLLVMKESTNSSGVPTTRLASNMCLADVSVEAAQFANENDMKIA